MSAEVAGIDPVPAPASRLLRAAEADVSVTARAMVDAFVRTIPLYAMLPDEQVRGEITELCRSTLRALFATLREGRPPGPDELAAARASAARRAEEHVPLEDLLSAYALGSRIGFRSLRSHARPEETDELVALTDGILTFLQAVTGAVAASYLEEQQAISSEARDAHRTLVAGLLDGTDVTAAAERAGVVLGGPYVVLAVHLGPAEVDDPTGLGSRVRRRRAERTLQEALDRVAGQRAPAHVAPDGVLAVLPLTGRPLAAVTDRLGDLALTTTATTGRPVLLAVGTAADAAGLPAAGALAVELRELAVALGRPPGAYRLADLLLEYQLSRSTAASGPLLELLAPVSADLRLTLQTWLSGGMDRRATAAALHVHPNTLDYRLRRVAELTGVDPATGHGAQLLAAAVAAGRSAR